MPRKHDIQYREETILTQKHGFETLGQVSLVFALLITLRFLFGILNVPYAPIVALVGTVSSVVIWSYVKSTRLKSQKAKASELRAQLSELEEKEFALRYEEAKLNGRLDRWDTKSEYKFHGSTR